MARLLALWVALPLFASACSFINAPDEIDPGTSSGGGGTGGEATGGTTTSDTTSTSTAPPDECGDGKRTGTEECDDDNVAPGDGCDANCAKETGFTCTGPDGGLSVCEKDCGNGTVDMGEECDDGGKKDNDPTDGDQDPCNDLCKFQEFDIELSKTTVSNEAPAVTFRRDKDKEVGGTEYAAFFPIWYSSVLNKIRGREYKFDGFPLKGTGTDDFSEDFTPDTAGHTVCTAGSNRSIVFWRHVNDSKIHSRKIESTGAIEAAAAPANILNVTSSPSCAAALDSNTFVAAAVGDDGAGQQVFVQPYASFAQIPNGPPVGLGLLNGPTETAAWPVYQGFMVAWTPDFLGGAPIIARPFDKNGAPVLDVNGMPFSFEMTDPADTGVRQPSAVRIGITNADNSFVFVYLRNNPGGFSEVIYRVFNWPNLTNPPTGSIPVAASSEMSSQSEPRIAVNPMNGKFIIVWTVLTPQQENVVFKTFGSDGKATSPETTAPEKLPGKQSSPAVTVDPQTGDVAIVWATDIATDTKPSRIAGKIFPGLLK